MSALLLIQSVNFFCNSFSTQSCKSWMNIYLNWRIKNKIFPKFGNHRGNFDQVSTFGNILANYILKLKIRLSQSLKAIVEVLIKCQHLAAADVSTAPRTINHFRELGIRKSFQFSTYQGRWDNFATHPTSCYMMLDTWERAGAAQ